MFPEKVTYSYEMPITAFPPFLNEISRQAEETISFDIPKINAHKLTTGYNFEGYQIMNYIGLVSGEIVIGTGFLYLHLSFVG